MPGSWREGREPCEMPVRRRLGIVIPLLDWIARLARLQQRFLTLLWMLSLMTVAGSVPIDGQLVAMSLRQEVLLDRAPAAQVVEILRKRFPTLEFIPHPVLNGFYAMGPRLDILRMKSLIPDLDVSPVGVVPSTVKEIVLLHCGDLEEVLCLLQTLVPDVTMHLGEKEQSLLLEGTALAVSQAKELLVQLDRPLDQIVLECKVLQKANLPIDWTAEWEGRVRETGEIIPLRLGVLKKTPPDPFQIASSQTRVLASPRVAMQAETIGEIHVGDKIPLGLRHQDVGLLLKLEVTLEEDERKMHLALNGEFTVPLELQAGRYAKVRTLLFRGGVDIEDGQSIVLEGLLTPQEAREAANNIPLLLDLPILGHLFRSPESMTGLYLILTPNLMK